ncbi:transmembrane emp24 domain-containing protein 11 isoform X1 [Panthera onca]|uniref:transmembrane emp24 domain-containing protein 11 isoform X1 n=1 Tax=Panthera onca TaxID=9690 RepID=UPI002952EE66|nr:transmembrane emp24 domain-containing protein 11 isoform X1 [Panthera onca]
MLLHCHLVASQGHDTPRLPSSHLGGRRSRRSQRKPLPLIRTTQAAARITGVVTLSPTGTFRIQQWDTRRHDFLESAPGLGMFVTVTTYNDEVLLSKLYGPQGTFYFTSHSPGEHIICLESNSTRLVSFGGSKLRIHLEIRVGQHDLDAAAAQAKDKVNEVSFKLERLIEQIEQIVKEQNYQRDREENFRMTSEDTNSNVLWWAFAQTLIFIAIGIFQMKHLKDFFIAKKLV